MRRTKFLNALAGLLLGLMAASAAEPEKIKTLDVAESVLKKGFTIVDLGKYPGILMLHGMSELARIHPERKEELLRETIGFYKKYATQEIKGRGSFICYEAGGCGPAMLHYMKLADGLGPQVEDAARRMVQNQKRSTDGILIPHWAKETQVFIDMAFAVSPYLLYSGLAFDRPEYVDLAVFETLELHRILADKETGLVHQGRGFSGVGSISEDNWSRGNGWASFALSLLVRDLPEKHPKREEVVRLAKLFYATVIKHQNANGLWHQEMTDKTSYVETSGSGLLLYGLGIMIEKGLMDKQYKQNVEKGLRGYLAYIDRDGSVSHACKGCLCPGKGTKDEYKNQEWLLNDPHAFGPVVLAFAQAYRLGIKEIEPLPEGVRLPSGGMVPAKPRAYVRHIAERKEDLAWENDRIGFRVFGPPAKDSISSGIDIWAKSVDYPVLDKWYRQNRNGKSYHADWGEGGDFYANGYNRGCGGLAVWGNGVKESGKKTFYRSLCHDGTGACRSPLHIKSVIFTRSPGLT